METTDQRGSTIRLTLLLTLCVVAFLVAINWDRYFADPILEQGDPAANAMQVERCKQWIEIYGNYSRFSFNHPGPGFFYVYSLGQVVLHDWLQVVPSPHNAHLLASMCLQSFFFALALAIFRRHVRGRLFVPLATLLAAVHFGLGQYAFTSLWAPHFPLMPFLCLFVANCSVAYGRGEHLPASILAGCFLVHGHVAQPLFVVSLFLVAYASFWVRTRARSPGASPVREFGRAHLVAGVILVLFLLPLVIDWLQWPDNNLACIFRHLTRHGDDHKSWGLSLVYLLSFFAYLHNQDSILEGGAGAGLGHLREHWHWYAGWAAAFVFVVASHWRGRRNVSEPGAAAERGFVRTVAVFWLVTVLLCGVWGVMQAGPMFEFNGHFYFSVTFVPLLLVAVTLSRWWGGRPVNLVGCALFVAALLVARGSFTLLPMSKDGTGMPILAATEAVLAADPRADAPKVIVMEGGDWPVVAGSMLQLVRRDVRFAIDPMWGFAFGRYRVLPSQTPSPTIDDMSVWRFLRRPPEGVGVPYPGGLRVTFEPGRIDPANATIACGIEGQLEQFLVTGFMPPDPGAPDRGFHYTVSREAVLQVGSPQAARDVGLVIRARAFLMPPHVKSQSMRLWVNGHEIGGAQSQTSDERDVVLSIPVAVWNARLPATVVMSLPDARSLSEVGVSSDLRAFGWAIRSLTFRYAD